MTDKRRFSGEYADDPETLHTPGGMTDPADSRPGGAPTAPTWRLPICPRSPPPARRIPSRYSGAAGGLPIEPPRRRAPPRGPARGGRRPAPPTGRGIRQLPEARQPGAGRAGRPSQAGARRPAARRAGRPGPPQRRGRRDARRRAAPGGGARWTGSSGRSSRPPGSSASIRPASRSIPACTRRSRRSRPRAPSGITSVSATFQPGYRFKGTLVRPARVQVYSEQGQA